MYCARFTAFKFPFLSVVPLLMASSEALLSVTTYDCNLLRINSMDDCKNFENDSYMCTQLVNSCALRKRHDNYMSYNTDAHALLAANEPAVIRIRRYIDRIKALLHTAARYYLLMHTQQERAR